MQEWIESEPAISRRAPEFVDADPAETSRGSLTRALRLYRELQKLEEAPGYQFAFRSRQDAWQGVKEDFRVFLAESHVFFVLFDQLTPIEGQRARRRSQRRRNATVTFAGTCIAT